MCYLNWALNKKCNLDHECTYGVDFFIVPCSYAWMVLAFWPICRSHNCWFHHCRGMQNFQSIEFPIKIRSTHCNCPARAVSGQCHEIFDFRFFFMNQFPPGPWVYQKGRFKFFWKFAEIFAAQGTPPVSLTPVANLPPVSTTLAKLMAIFAAGVVDTDDNFAVGVVDISGKFAIGVIDTGAAPWLANISENFRKKIEMVLMGYLWAGGKLIHEKKTEAKNLVTLSL